MAEFDLLQKRYHNVTFDLKKQTSILKLRGREEFVIPAKEEVLSVDVKMETLEISSREAASIVGKSGQTVNRLVADHDVSIQVESQKNDDKSTILVSGQGKNVDAAIKEIKDILFKNEDIEMSFLVGSIVRNKMLSDSGALVKQLRKDVNNACQPGTSFVRFEELNEDASDSSSLLYVKSPRMHVDMAEKIIKERLAMFDSATLMMQIDVELIPVLIGPKGSNIKSIRQLGGSGADVEVDKLTGEIKILADKEAGRTAIKNAIQTMVDENQILRVPMESSMFADIFGQAGKAIKSKIQGSGVFMKIDDSDTSILLRGSIDKVKRDDNFVLCNRFCQFTNFFLLF